MAIINHWSRSQLNPVYPDSWFRQVSFIDSAKVAAAIPTEVLGGLVRLIYMVRLNGEHIGQQIFRCIMTNMLTNMLTNIWLRLTTNMFTNIDNHVH